MKKQLLLLAVACSFNCAIKAQNADAEQKLSNPGDNNVPVLTTKRSNSPVVQSTSCVAEGMCPQINTNTGNVRGYFFIAPVSFSICGLRVPTDASTGPQSIAVVRFHGMTPPAYPSVTNNFDSLFYVASDTGLITPVSCSIPINAGDTIGIYGARSTSSICSYGSPACVISILGYTVTLTRSGMQFPLYNQQMHDVWSEAGSDISRVIMYVDSSSTGVHENNLATSLEVYPNPSKGIFTVEMKNGKMQAAQVEIYNYMGERVYNAALQATSRIDLSNQAEGVYFVQVKTSGGVLTKKIIVSR